MPPIKVFTNSPINASNPNGTTPETSQHQQSGQQINAPPPTSAQSQQQNAYPAAQPHAIPSFPQPTSSCSTTTYQPTPTRALSGDGSSGSPPPPQPGAVPVPPGGGLATSTQLPPPPKAGEKLSSQHQPPPTTTMPPQMSYSLPATNVPSHHLGSSTSTEPPAQTPGYPGPPRPTTLMEGGMGGGSGYGQQQPLGGYQQNMSPHQQRSYDDDRGYDSQDETVWGTAKKWAFAAGDSLAKAENEVWKRINKD